MKIFISYRRAEDNKSNIVWTIHEKLAQVFGTENVFRDTNDIHGGESWRLVLEREANSCKVMVVVIGPEWATLTNPDGQRRLFDVNDVTRWEIETGLRRRIDEGVTLIPVRVLGAPIPQKGDLPESLWQLFDIQWRELQNAHFDFDIKELIADIRRSRGYAEEDITAEYFEPKTIYIAEGPFWMGSKVGEGVPSYETPGQEIFLPAYRIGKYPVTNSQYAEFISQTKTLVSPIMGWDGQNAPKGLENHPVGGVTWYEALAYCQWLSQKTKRRYSLPTEAQWERACRGGNNTMYPWGDEFDVARCNYGQPNMASVDKYPPQNDFGCFDFVGNIRQWTSTLWGEKRIAPDPKYAYPWQDDGRNDLNAPGIIRRVIRGGILSDSPRGLACSARSSNAPDNPGPPGKRMGFRVMLEDI